MNGTASIRRAVATFAADNHFKLQVNGQDLGGGDDWQNPAASVRGAVYQGRVEDREICEVGAGKWTFTAKEN